MKRAVLVDAVDEVVACSWQRQQELLLQCDARQQAVAANATGAATVSARQVAAAVSAVADVAAVLAAFAADAVHGDTAFGCHVTIQEERNHPIQAVACVELSVS